MFYGIRMDSCSPDLKGNAVQVCSSPLYCNWESPL